MTTAQLLDLKGKKVGQVNLADHVFGIEPNQAVMHSAVVRQLGNARSGSANTKTRSEVAGGGRKPWRQKGTGRARAGSIRSPLWAGGGVIFGPKPRDYSSSMPKKVRQLAIRSALAAKREDIVVVKDFADIKAPKTKEMAQVFAGLGLAEKKVLLVLDFACENCQVVERSARNIEGVVILHVSNLNVKDLLDCDKILTTERTLEAINNRFCAETCAESEDKSEGKAKKAKTSKAKDGGAE